MNVNYRKSVLPRVGVVALFLFVICYQFRSSIETIHRARNLDFWLPFSVEAFSDLMEDISTGIESPDPIAKTIRFDREGPFHLLAVNKRPFSGMSMYLTQLWNHHPTIGVDPSLQILMRYGNSRPFPAWFLIPHCTCSGYTVWELIQLLIIPPVFCVLLAFLLVLRRPVALHVWAMSALLLSLSQLDLFPHRAGFQWTANTMAWVDWFRVPATLYRALAQNVWPAALVLAVSYLFPIKPVAQKWSRRIAVALLAFCAVQSCLSLAWSEYYLPFAPFYDWLQQYRSEMVAVTLTTVAAVAFLHERALGAIVLMFAGLASSVLYWPAPPVSAKAVIPAFAVVTVLAVLLFEVRRTKRLLLLSILSLVPPALYLLGVLNDNIAIGIPWSRLVFLLLCSGGGLLGTSVYCLSTQASPQGPEMHQFPCH